MSHAAAVVVFGSSQTIADSVEWKEAEWVGKTLADRGLTVITGGYGGTMEAVSRGAAESGGHVIGVTAPNQFPHREGANRFVTEAIEATDVIDRIGILIHRASGAIAMPGSIGTATELLIAWNINHIARGNGGHSIPTVAIGPQWKTVAETLVSEIDAFPGDIHLSPSAEDGVNWLLQEL